MSFIASGLAIAGIATEFTVPIAIGEALGAGIGALTNPQNPGKGALMGGLGGALTGGIGAGIGGLAGGAASGAAEGVAGEVGQLGSAAATETASNAGGTLGSQFGALGAEPGVTAPLANIGGNTMGQIAQTGGMAAPSAVAAVPTSLTSGGFTGFGNAGDWLAKEAGSKVVTGVPQAISQSIANAQTEKDSNKIHDQYFHNYAHGGEVQHVARQGGSIKLQDGAFIIPADVVSALGNGSSKAGAKYLTHLMRVLEAGPQQEPKAGRLASQRLHRRYG